MRYQAIYTSRNARTGNSAVKNFEPFDVIASLLILGSMALMIAGAYLNNEGLFESAKYITISVTSAYMGKRWGKDGNGNGDAPKK